MATTPESMQDITIDFRAPPPSPVASGRRSSVTNNEVLTEFLETSLRVPDLVLPDKIFPKQKFHETPPKVDFRLLCSEGDQGALCGIVLDSMARTGCFQLVHHGIPRELMVSVAEAAKGIFHVSPEKKAAVTRAPEKPWGFEEHHAEEQGSELDEEFLWCRDDDLKLKMEGIWPFGYSKFSEKMETLVSNIQKVAEKILAVMLRNCSRKLTNASNMNYGDEVGTICCVYKHNRDEMEDSLDNSLKYDVIRMLIRGTDYSHALCLHVCDGSTAFHVYSKKGWLSFCPEEGALIITGGDQTQVVSGGHYKHVIGRAIFKGEREDSISMAFLYSPSNKHTSFQSSSEGTISLVQQAILAIILTLAYKVLVYVYQKL